MAAGARRARLLPSSTTPCRPRTSQASPCPTLLALGGALAGLLVGFLAGVLVRAGARRRARAAARALRAPVERVADEHVLGPVRAELDAHARLCEALARAATSAQPGVFVAS